MIKFFKYLIVILFLLVSPDQISNYYSDPVKMVA